MDWNEVMNSRSTGGTARRGPRPSAQAAARRGDRVVVNSDASGRIEGPRKPVYIRAVGAPVSRRDRDYMRRKLDRKLRKFDEVVERSSVRVEDVNGPRGGVDKRCRIKVVLSGLPSVVVEARHYSPQAAIDGALDRVERTVWRAVQRQRTHP